MAVASNGVAASLDQSISCRRIRGGSGWDMRSIVSTIVAVLAACFAVAGYAQVPLPNPNVPLLTNGVVYAVVRLPDNSTVIGGSFSRVNDTPRANLAKLKPDGTLDPDWHADTDDGVNALAVDANGNVIVAGEFYSVSNVSRFFLAKVSGTGTGTVDPIWNPNSNGSVNTIVIDGNGKIIVGGLFAHIGGQDRQHIARLSGSGAGDADATWNPSADATIFALAVDGSNNVYVSGSFEQIGGQARHYLAKLSGSGTGLADLSWNPGVTGYVYALTVYSGAVYAGGYFSNIGGQPRTNLARLADSTGAALSGWIPGVNSIVEDIAIDAGGNVYVVGDFSVINSWIVDGIARLSGIDASVDLSWNPKADSTVYSIDLDGSGDVRVGGGFVNVDSQPAGGFALIDSNATTIAAATTDSPGYAYTVLRQSDGGLIVGGDFWKAGATPRNNLLRIRPDGTLDPDWNPSPQSFQFDAVFGLAADASDHVYVGGTFNTIGGQARTGLARLEGHGSGAADATWNPEVQGSVLTVAIDESGYIYAGGQFTNAGRQSRSNIARLSPSGAGDADATWNPSADERVFCIDFDLAGEVFAGGFFTNIGGQPQKYLARLSPVGPGAASATWDPVLDGYVYAVSAQDNGTVYAAGTFTHIDGTARGAIARLSGSGSGLLDAIWNPSANADVYSFVTDATGNVYVGGNFTTIGGQSRKKIAKLSGLGTGLADPSWNPGASGGFGDGRVQALALNPNGYLDVVGRFTSIGGQQRGGIAVLPTQFDRIFANAFD